MMHLCRAVRCCVFLVPLSRHRGLTEQGIPVPGSMPSAIFVTDGLCSASSAVTACYRAMWISADRLRVPGEGMVKMYSCQTGRNHAQTCPS